MEVEKANGDAVGMVGEILTSNGTAVGTTVRKKEGVAVGGAAGDILDIIIDDGGDAGDALANEGALDENAEGFADGAAVSMDEGG